MITNQEVEEYKLGIKVFDRIIIIIISVFSIVLLTIPK